MYSMKKTNFTRTKILATIGPATNSYEAIFSMINSGVSGFRLNFSHGSYEEREEQIAWIRQASKEVGKAVAILQDLQGPKIRLGNLVDNNYPVKAGDILTLSYGSEHDGSTLPIQYNLAQKVQVGEKVYLFDGKIEATVTKVPNSTDVVIQLQNDGTLMSRKGVNLPDTDFGGDILTPKDIQDIEYGADKDIDFVALSFVQSADDILELKKRLKSLGSEARVISKVETKQAVEEENLEAVVEASDGVMIARGDMAYEVGTEVVPVVQEKIVDLCRKHGKVSIVATQMLASMVDEPRPTRAEVSDVAHAVMQGSDVVMLSDETANGSYPIEAVMTMNNVIQYTQNHSQSLSKNTDSSQNSVPYQQNAIAKSAVNLAKELNANCLVAQTSSGGTAFNLAACRPSTLLLCVTDSKRVAQQLALSYGAVSVVREDSPTAGYDLVQELKNQGYFRSSDPVMTVIVSGMKLGVVGSTDTIQVRAV